MRWWVRPWNIHLIGWGLLPVFVFGRLGQAVQYAYLDVREEIQSELRQYAQKKAGCQLRCIHTINYCATCGRDELDMPACPYAPKDDGGDT